MTDYTNLIERLTKIAKLEAANAGLDPNDAAEWEAADAIKALQAKLDALAKQEPTDLEAVQWRNIQKVVHAVADWAFGGKDHPDYGHCWLAVVNSLTAQDGLDITALRLEPLIAAPKALESAEASDAANTLRHEWRYYAENEGANGGSLSRAIEMVCNVLQSVPKQQAKALAPLTDEQIEPLVDIAYKHW